MQSFLTFLQKGLSISCAACTLQHTCKRIAHPSHLELLCTAPPATSSRATNPRQHRPKDLNKTRCDINLVEIKYCEDTRPQNQLNAVKEQHKDQKTFFKEHPLFSTSSFWVWGAPCIYTHTLKPFKELGFDSQRVLALKLHVHSLCELRC